MLMRKPEGPKNIWILPKSKHTESPVPMEDKNLKKVMKKNLIPLKLICLRY